MARSRDGGTTSRAVRYGACALLVCALVSIASATVARAPGSFGFTATGGPIDARAPAGLDPVDPASCAGCHAEVAREWQGSMHARSSVDPIFRAELAESRDAGVCLSCHAPMDVAGRGGPAADVGVACGACHVRDGAILTRASNARADAAHPMRVVADFGGADFCAGCHDFRFPLEANAPGAWYDPDTMQQQTVSEWATTDHARAGVSCTTCHMPETRRSGGRTGRSHALRSLEDPAFVAGALSVHASAADDADGVAVELVLTVRGAGHAVPSGDIFRELHVTASNDCGSSTRILMRNFAEVHGARGWVLTDSYDDRVFPGEPKRVALRLPRCAGTTRYELRLLRLAEAPARRRGFEERDYVVPLASGTITTGGTRR